MTVFSFLLALWDGRFAHCGGANLPFLICTKLRMREPCFTSWNWLAKTACGGSCFLGRTDLPYRKHGRNQKSVQGRGRNPIRPFSQKMDAAERFNASKDDARFCVLLSRRTKGWALYQFGSAQRFKRPEHLKGRSVTTITLNFNQTQSVWISAPVR